MQVQRLSGKGGSGSRATASGLLAFKATRAGLGGLREHGDGSREDDEGSKDDKQNSGNERVANGPVAQQIESDAELH